MRFLIVNASRCIVAAVACATLSGCCSGPTSLLIELQLPSYLSPKSSVFSATLGLDPITLPPDFTVTMIHDEDRSPDSDAIELYQEDKPIALQRESGTTSRGNGGTCPFGATWFHATGLKPGQYTLVHRKSRGTGDPVRVADVSEPGWSTFEGEEALVWSLEVKAVPPELHSWTVHTSTTSQDLRAVWGASPQEIYAVGHAGTVLHHDGKTWSVMTTGTDKNLWDLWGSGPADLFIVGSDGVVLHKTGPAWAAMASGTTQHLLGISGSGPDDIWAVGAHGACVHYDGVAWTAVDTKTTDGLQAVYSAGPKDAYAVGVRGTILHHDGTGWSPMASGTTEDLFDISGSGPDHLHAVGHGGVIVSFDGSSWSVTGQGAKFAGNLVGVWTDPASKHTFAVGSYGMIKRHDGSGAGWTEVYSGHGQHLNGVWGFGAVDVVAVGSKGTILSFPR